MSESITIIGSGLTGLILGQSLKNQGHSVLLIDKGRKPGGRLLSKLVDNCICEMGPGWFHTLDGITPDFLFSALKAVSAEPVAFDNLPETIQSGLICQSDLQSWKIPGGIRRLTDELARPLDVLQSIQLKSLKKRETDWLMECIDYAHGEDLIEMVSSNLVLTAPWPQSLELLQNSELLSADSLKQFADLPDYEKCLVAAFTIGNGAGESIHQAWLEPDGDDVVKRFQIEKSESGGYTLVVHAHDEFSDRHLSDPDNLILTSMKQSAIRHLNVNLETAPALLQRWKYATLKLAKSIPTEPMVISRKPSLILAGEAFGLSDQVHVGILSAQNSAKQVADIIMSVNREKTITIVRNTMHL